MPSTLTGPDPPRPDFDVAAFRRGMTAIALRVAVAAERRSPVGATGQLKKSWRIWRRRGGDDVAASNLARTTRVRTRRRFTRRRMKTAKLYSRFPEAKHQMLGSAIAEVDPESLGRELFGTVAQEVSHRLFSGQNIAPVEWGARRV